MAISRNRAPKLLREAVPAEIFSITVGIAAGMILSSMSDSFSSIKGLFVLLPILYGLSNDIDGSLAARLNSALHIGAVTPALSFSRSLTNIILASFILSSVTATCGGVAAHFFSLAIGLQSAGLFKLVLISFLSNLLSKALTIPLTVILTFFFFRNRIDPSSVMGPLLTSYGDVLTLSSIYVTINLVRHIETFETVLTISLIPLTLILYLFSFRFIQTKDHREHETYRMKKIVRESLPLLIIPLSWTGAGGLAIAVFEELFLRNRALLVLLPPLSDLAGDFGCIISSRLSESLHLGRIQPTFREVFTIKWELLIIVVTGFISAAYLGLLGYLTTLLLRLETLGFIQIVGISLLSVNMLVLFQILLSIIVSFVSFARGLDPDNVAIPIVADLGDMGGILFLIASCILFGIL